MAKNRIKNNGGTLGNIGRWAVRIFLFLWAVCVVFPLIWTFYTSFKNNQEFYADVWALPKVWRTENYEFAWNVANFSSYYLNSIFTVVLTLALTLLMTTTTSYAVAKFRYRWLKLFDKFYIVVMAIPGVLLLIPQYFMFLKWGWTDNLVTLALLLAVGSVPFSVFMQMSFMRRLDNALLEAAEVDGASEFQKFFKIVLPCVKPALFVTALMNVMGTWNEYVRSLTFLSDETKYTVPIGLSQLQNSSTYSVEYGGLFAGLVIAMIPILVIYAFFQKQLLNGVASEGSVKG